MRLIIRELLCVAILASVTTAQNNNIHNPTWWAKYQYLSTNGAIPGGGQAGSLSVGSNVNASNECGPQSETFISLNPNHPKILVGASNEIFRLPQRGYFSRDGGASWGATDMPLPPSLSGTNDTDFASDPGVAFDTLGNVFSSYIVVFFGNGSGVNGTELAVARSTDNGQTFPSATFFSFATGGDHFNDKPLMAADTNPNSPFRDHLYVAWDAASGGSSAGGIRVAHSSDHGASFAAVRADTPSGPSQSIGADPFVGPNGELYVAWNDYHANIVAFNSSFDGGLTFGTERVVSLKTAAFDVGIPAESFRRALVYPACDADRSRGPNHGRLYCSWMDFTASGTTDILLSYSDNQGNTWSKATPVTDQLPFPVDRFNHWLSVDPVTGDVNVSFYDTRNDTTGQRFQTDVFFSQSRDGGKTFRSPNTRVTNALSNEHDCSGLFPCPGIEYFDQQGDYEGLVSFGGVSHPIWTDSREQLDPPSCDIPKRGTVTAMEEVFTATVQ